MGAWPGTHQPCASARTTTWLWPEETQEDQGFQSLWGPLGQGLKGDLFEINLNKRREGLSTDGRKVTSVFPPPFPSLSLLCAPRLLFLSPCSNSESKECITGSGIGRARDNSGLAKRPKFFSDEAGLACQCLLAR